MPEYRFQCDKVPGHVTVVLGSMSDPPIPSTIRCCLCGSTVFRDYAGVQVSTFRPFVDTMSDGVPCRIGSARERDLMLASKGMTLDRTTYTRPKKQDTIEVNEDKIKEIIEYEEKNREAIKAEIKESKGKTFIDENTKEV